MFRLPDPPTAVFAGQHLAGRGALRAMLATGHRADLTVFDELDPDLLVVQPQVVVESDPVRLGTVGAQMTLERLDGFTGAARDVVLPPLFRRPTRPAEAVS